MKLQRTNGSKFQAVFLETKSVSSWFDRGSVTCRDFRPLAHPAVVSWSLKVRRPFTKTHTFESPLGKEINAQIVFALPTETLIKAALQRRPVRSLLGQFTLSNPRIKHLLNAKTMSFL